MSSTADVLRNLDNKMAMISRDVLQEWQKSGKKMEILDFRSAETWKGSHIQGSMPVSIQELPDRYEDLLPHKESTIICVCNGAIQSAMAVVFLRSEGYENCYNLSGGFSGWLKAELPVEQSTV
ncbi:MAG: rhodanese-like domain-containing protein [Spirochaetales bacterium]|nr:rhodanese-like domain-containing protein [Spirochaetales bacterium]